MVDWSHLVLPALLAAVFVFIASSVIHMVLQWHKSEYGKLTNEDEVLAAMRKGGASPGQYMFPYCGDHKQMASEEMQRKFREGPVGMMILRPTGNVQLGPFLAKWFVYTIVVGLLAGYVARSTLKPGEHYLAVFRVVGTVAWLAYSWQSPADSIWKGKPWIATCRDLVDGLIYGALTAGCFAWLWPR